MKKKLLPILKKIKALDLDRNFLNSIKKKYNLSNISILYLKNILAINLKEPQKKIKKQCPPDAYESTLKKFKEQFILIQLEDEDWPQIEKDLNTPNPKEEEKVLTHKIESERKKYHPDLKTASSSQDSAGKRTREITSQQEQTLFSKRQKIGQHKPSPLNPARLSNN